jgi:RNA polymerase sigma factor (sigma-70 family)
LPGENLRVPSGTSPDFEDIFDQHFEDVYSYVAYRVAPQRELARDLTQEVFLSALKGWPAYRHDGSPLTWLRSIARNKVTDHFRSLATAGSGTSLDFEQLIRGLSFTSSKPEDRTVLVSLVMRRLPPDYAELLEQKYLENLSVKEIAAQKGFTEKAVASALHRARESFRTTFAKIQSRQG